MTLYVGSKKIAQKIGVASTGVKLPDQTDNAGKFLSTDGTVLAWTNPTEQVEQDIASINEKLIKKTHITNCITEIPQDIKMEITSEIGDVWYAWVNFIVGYVLYSKTEAVANGDELYIRDDYGNYKSVRTIGTDVTIVDDTTLQDDVNMGYNLTRNSEYDRGEIYQNLVIKAGSLLNAPNGLDGEQLSFTVKSPSNDVIVKNNSKSDGRYYIIVENDSVIFEDLDNIMVGEELPTENMVENNKFYNITTNFIYNYNGTEWVETSMTLPLGIIIIKDKQIYDFDEVFNGFGFMGNLAYVLPGVKAFLPLGKNEDGTYNSDEYTQESIKFALIDYESTSTGYLIFGRDYFGFADHYVEQTVQPEDVLYTEWYNPSSNYILFYDRLLQDWFRYSEMCVASDVIFNGKLVTAWNIKKVIKLADQNEVNDRIEEVANELETVFDTKLNNKIDEVNTEINEVRGYAETVQENVETVDTKLEEFKQTIQVVSALPENPETGVLYFVRA